jgi:hypothetical protein
MMNDKAENFAAPQGAQDRQGSLVVTMLEKKLQKMMPSAR